VARENLLAYYTQRAREYEQIYEKPERQSDLGQLRSWVCETLAGHQVLEIACGTGYWTAIVAPVAASITASDASTESLALAALKEYPPGRVRLVEADAYGLEQVAGEFTAGLAAFWWSHVPREQQSVFLTGLHRRLRKGALVVLMDNRFVPGSSTAISRRDPAGNTYQERRLADGRTCEVLKNFPDRTELQAVFATVADELLITELPYYWTVRYRVASAA